MSTPAHENVDEQGLRRFFMDVGSRMESAESKSDRTGQNELEKFFTSIGSCMKPLSAPWAQRPSRQSLEHSDLQKFFDGGSLQMQSQRRLDKKRASEFNVFDLIIPDENKLSDVLWVLLDPEGRHGQGDLFLRLLFRQLGVGSGLKHTRNATVQREAPTHGIQKYRRRIDVFVKAGVLVAIENKIDSSEGPEQVKDYLEHLDYCTKGNRKDSVLIYLSPDGRRPESLNRATFDEAITSGRLQCWRHQIELRGWLAACRRHCQAEKIRIFLSDFMTYVESHLKRESSTEEETNEK
jgi:hypothetical protein